MVAVINGVGVELYNRLWSARTQSFFCVCIVSILCCCVYYAVFYRIVFLCVCVLLGTGRGGGALGKGNSRFSVRVKLYVVGVLFGGCV